MKVTIDHKVIDFAITKHKGQKDDAGRPFVFHCANVANILLQVTDDPALISAAFLHDTLEDTDTTLEELQREFGHKIASLVHEVTHEGSKDTGYYFPRLKSREAIMLKLADRLSNVSRMEPWSEERKAHYLKKTKFWRSEPLF